MYRPEKMCLFYKSFSGNKTIAPGSLAICQILLFSPPTSHNRLVAVRIREMSSFRAKSKYGEFFIPQEQPRVAGDHRNGRAPVHDFVAAF